MAKRNSNVVSLGLDREPPEGFDVNPEGPRPILTSGVTGSLKRVKNVVEIEVDKISPDPNQPRKEFDLVLLEELAASLKEEGQLQPIIVRRDRDTDGYIIQTGERRWRAARLAGLQTLECKIEKRTLTERELLIRQYVENENRDGFKPLELARIYKTIMDDEGCSMGELSKILKTSKATISKTLSALSLSEEEQQIASSLSVEQLWEVSKIKGDSQRRKQIDAFASGTAAPRHIRRATAKPKGTKREKTIRGAKIRVDASRRLSNAEVATRLREFAEHLERDGRSTAA